MTFVTLFATPYVLTECREVWRCPWQYCCHLYASWQNYVQCDVCDSCRITVVAAHLDRMTCSVTLCVTVVRLLSSPRVLTQRRAVWHCMWQLRKDFEEDKQAAVGRAVANVQRETERVRRQTEERCREQYMEEMRKLSAKHKADISAAKKKQWVSGQAFKSCTTNTCGRFHQRRKENSSLNRIPSYIKDISWNAKLIVIVGGYLLLICVLCIPTCVIRIHFPWIVYYFVL